jgi:hypothetical protein
MMKRTGIKRIVGIVILLCLWSQVYSQTDCYPDVPSELDFRAGKAAEFIVDNNAGTIARDSATGKYPFVNGLGLFIKEIYAYTLVDAVTPTDNAASLRSLEAYRYMGETARTDKQVGSSPRTEGSTTAAEKPGFVDLLGFAIEHGTIQQESNGTTLTLSTSPYALVAAAYGDTAETYQTYEFLNRIGVSASFDIGNQDALLTNVHRQQLSEWAVKARLYGDRSLRSKEFERFWVANIKPKIQRRLNVITGLEDFISNDPQLKKRRLMMSDPADPTDADAKAMSLNDKIADYLNANLTETRDKKVAAVKSLILCQMRALVFTPITQNIITIDPTMRIKITQGFVPSLVMAHEELKKARELLDQFLAEFNKKPMVTLAYNNERVPTGQNYQVLKILFEQDVFHPMKMVANAGVSFYNSPDPMMKQQRVRDFAAALSFEGKLNSPFTTNEADQSKVTYSFTGRYQRLLENRFFAGRKADIGTAQFRLEIPFLSGLSFPFSVSYNTASEQSNKSHFRTNFGLALDADKLFALKKLKTQ